MNRLFFIPLLTAVFVSAGCAAFDTDTKQLQAACVGITTATKVITANRTLIDQLDEQKVADALEIATPICGQGAEPTADKVTLALVQSAQAKLDAIVEKLQ